ncbi:MAG: hypothetical protein Kow0031_20990 [Anaerolineae bacterium]
MMRLIRVSVLVVLALVTLAGLNRALAAPAPQAEAKLFPHSADGESYGFVDETGQWVIEPQFDFAGEFSEGLAVIEQDGKYGFVGPDGAIVIEPEYDFAAGFSQGLAPVALDGLGGFIDPTGQRVIEPQFYDARPFTEEGLAVVRLDDGYGYINADGDVVIEPQFDSAFSFSEGLAAVVADGSYGYINPDGDIVIEPQFDFAAAFSEGLAAVLINGQMGYIDPDGQLVIEPQFDVAQDFSEGLAAVSVGGLVGFIDAAGQPVVEPQYDYAESFSEGLAAVRQGDLIGYIDATGEMVIPPRFDDAGPFRDGLARVERAHRWGYITPAGTAAFLLPVPAMSPEATLIIPFLPNVPDESREGLCLARSQAVPEPFAWSCIFRGDEPDEISTFDPCLTASDGETIVCGADPMTGARGFWVDLMDPLPEEPIGAELPGGGNDAWLLQLADGAVCRYLSAVSFTVNGEPANYTCSDGSLLLGDLQPGTVWQTSQVALGDTVRTDDGFTAEADALNAPEIAAIWQPVDPAAVLAEIGLTAEQLSLDTSGIADTITPQIRPAVPYNPAVLAGLDGEPAHLRVAFGEDDLPNLGGVSPNQAQLLIYPVEDYLAMYEEAGVDDVAQKIDTLQALLQERPATVEGEIPMLPGVGTGEQVVRARVRYVDFDGGSGVRFITHYGIENTPITEHGLFYTFQGLTDDGKYYVAYYHPAPTELLPGDFESVEALLEDYDAFVENYDTYLQQVNEELEGAEPTDFTPDLLDIDAMLETLRISP